MGRANVRPAADGRTVNGEIDRVDRINKNGWIGRLEEAMDLGMGRCSAAVVMVMVVVAVEV